MQSNIIIDLKIDVAERKEKKDAHSKWCKINVFDFEYTWSAIYPDPTPLSVTWQSTTQHMFCRNIANVVKWSELCTTTQTYIYKHSDTVSRQ